MSKGKKAEPLPKLVGGIKSLIQSEDSLRQLVKEAVFEAINPLIARLNELDGKLLSCQNTSSDNSKKITQLETFTQQNKMDLRKIDQNNKLLETQIMDLQLQKSKNILRIQNFPEEQEKEQERGADLRSKMARLLTQLAKKDGEELHKEIVTAYRAGSGYTKKHNLPREIFVHFSSITTRNTILKNNEEEELRYKDRIITIRKEVPFLIRKKRAKYRDLTSLLLKEQIKFRYLLPEGVSFTFQGKQHRIITEEQKQTFMATFDGDFLPTQKEDDTETKTMKLRPRIKDSQKQQ